MRTVSRALQDWECWSHLYGKTKTEKSESEGSVVTVCNRTLTGPSQISRARHGHRGCTGPARHPWTTGWSLFWHFPLSHCRGWCSCKMRKKHEGDEQVRQWGVSLQLICRELVQRTKPEPSTHLSTTMQKSPLMVPGLELAGSVSPSITRPVFTAPLPSHTWITNTGHHEHDGHSAASSSGLQPSLLTMATTGPLLMYSMREGKKGFSFRSA